MDELYIGLMSGTSIDGVDAALVNFTNGFECKATYFEPYPENLRQQLLELVHAKQAKFSQLLDVDNEVSVIHALAVKKLLDKAKLNSNRINAIGYHGQTLHHQPQGEHRNSLQIGNPSFLAEHTGITTVSDFRRRDMAAGGQGAPFAPAFHEYLFRQQGVTRAIINIGGIANITILPGELDEPISGFDTGPGNCLLDEWFNQHQQAKFDSDGHWASTGSSNSAALSTLLSDPYFSQLPPKSTGREYFNLDWLTEKLDLPAIAAQDLQATLIQLTCISIAHGIRDYAPTTAEAYVCGGGAHNNYLISQLRDVLTDIHVTTTAALGLFPDWVEACAFAWFAKQTMDGKALNLKTVTGASKNCIAGSIYQ